EGPNITVLRAVTPRDECAAASGHGPSGPPPYASTSTIVAVTPRPVRVAPSSRCAASTGSTASWSAPTGQILHGTLDSRPAGVNIHHMMTSSNDELSSTGDEAAIDISHLRVIRGKRPALHDFSVRVARGSITGLLGPSGCGKTTLIRCVVGTQIIASGTVRVLGLPAGSSPLRHRIGYLPQDPTIYDDLRIVDNGPYFAALYGFDGDAADSAIERVGLSDHSTAYCGNLSGGQRTRVSLACALVCQPELLVLDEPTVGLDPVLRADLWEQFTDLARGGTTLLVSSHVSDEAA